MSKSPKTRNDDLNRADLVRIAAKKSGLPVETVDRAAVAFLDAILETLAANRGAAVTNFGSWHPVVTPERQAHNPQTMEPVTVPEKFRVKIIAAPKMRKIVNGEAEPTIEKG